MVEISFKHKQTASLNLPFLRLEIFTDPSLADDQALLQELQTLIQKAWPIFLHIADSEGLYETLFLNIKNKVIQIELIWTDNKTMHALNAGYRQHDESTDVLTFTLLADAENPELWMSLPILQLGSMFISVEYAREALQKEITKKETLSHYLLERFIHGVLHLFGVHHDTMDKFDHVVAIQNKVLRLVFNENESTESRNKALNESTASSSTSF